MDRIHNIHLIVKRPTLPRLRYSATSSDYYFQRVLFLFFLFLFFSISFPFLSYYISFPLYICSPFSFFSFSLQCSAFVCSFLTVFLQFGYPIECQRCNHSVCAYFQLTCLSVSVIVSFLFIYRCILFRELFVSFRSRA